MSDEATLPPCPRRREADARLDALTAAVETLKAQHVVLQAGLDENNKTTKEVRDILATFHTLGRVAKWISYIAGAVAAVWAALHEVRGR